MDIEALVTVAVDCGFKTHKGLGPGLLESAYQAVMVEMLKRRGLSVEVVRIILIIFEDLTID